jgi:hypothetical protein
VLGRASVVLLSEQVGPVARHSIARTGDCLVLGMAFRWGKFGTFAVVIALVVPEPVLARFERSDDRVPSLSPMLRCVPGQRIVAATDMAAGRTPPQVHPPTTGGITLATANTTGRHRWVDSSSHRDSSFLADGVRYNSKSAGHPSAVSARSSYSHSMVPGGLLVTSSTTRLTSATSLVIRVEIRSSTS